MEIIQIILIVIGLLLFIYFGILVPVFISTNRAKFKCYDQLKEKYGLEGNYKMSSFGIVNPSIEGHYRNRKMKISTILSRGYYNASQKNSIPLTCIEMHMNKKSPFEFSMVPRSLSQHGKSSVVTGVEDFDAGLTVDTNFGRQAGMIFSAVIIEKIIRFRKNYGKLSVKIMLEKNRLTAWILEPSSWSKKLERTESIAEILLLIADKVESLASEFQTTDPYRS